MDLDMPPFWHDWEVIGREDFNNRDLLGQLSLKPDEIRDDDE